jgi:hypothetical protein
VKRLLRAFLLLVVAATFLAPAPPSDAQTDTVLGGYQGLASASGVHALYNIEGLLPLPPPVDIGSPDAYTTIVTGPTTFARASVADPGDLLASPDTLLGLAIPGYPAGTVPPYPFRIAASSGVGAPTAESNPAPGLNARVAANDGDSLAEATMPAANAPAVVTAGTSLARATTKTDGSTVTVRALSRTTGISLLGLLTIDSLVTDLTATSVGQATKLTGKTTVTGAKFRGRRVTIDAKGVHSPVGSLNEQLKKLGLRVAVAGPFEVSGGKSGQLGSTGLRIDFRFGADSVPGLVDAIDSLPPIDNPIPGAPVAPEDILAAAKAHNLASVEIGRGLVSLSARESAVFDVELPTALPDLPVLSLGESFDLPSAPLALTPGAPRAPLRATPAASIPTATGVGALILLALLAIPFIGDLIARACGAVLATNETEMCAMEER